MSNNIRTELETNGFAVVEGLFSNNEVEEMKNEIRRIIKEMPSVSHRTEFSCDDSESELKRNAYFLDSIDKIGYFFETGATGPNGELLVDPEVSLNKIGHGLHEVSPVFRKYTFCNRIKDIIRELGYKEPVILQSMYIFKNPEGKRSEVMLHQDATFLYTEPQSCTGVWIALDDVTREKGCLWFAKGSHKSGVHRRYIRNPDRNAKDLFAFTAPLPDYDKSSFTPVPVTKGSCVFIHGQVVHYSETNETEESRNAYTFHIVEQNNTIYPENNWIQPKEGKTFMKLFDNRIL
ncbi:phytanoyl-CoA dioxygenase domain-containing protein 1 homolog [Leptinotarsa decemlineata]|uniref:phytanoyl-CoA dioxygenase domain-containing protein 1 homolog n=1 Tax=Leptinotarsa decemlineata TaxID=7539 RepID=UPI003D304885